MYNLQSLRVPKNTQSGLAEHALVAKKEWFTPGGIKAPLAPFSTLADTVTIKDQHLFKAGLGFLYFQLIPGKNSLKGSTPGDPGLKRQTHEIGIFVPGLYEEVVATMNDLLNTPLITLVKDSDCGINTRYQLGNDCTGSWIGWEMGTGTTVDGQKGYALTVTYDGPILFYKPTSGIITMMPEVVPGAPVITSQPVSYQLTAGDTLVLTIAATNAVSYQWKKAGADIVGATHAVYTKAGGVLADADNYTCVVTNANGSVTSDPATISVIGSAPVITTQPADVTVTAGNPFNLSVVATGPQLAYQWKKGGVVIAGANSSIYSNGAAASGDAGSYICEITNPWGNIATTAAIVTVN